jgi:hypothetical protein
VAETLTVTLVKATLDAMVHALGTFAVVKFIVPPVWAPVPIRTNPDMSVPETLGDPPPNPLAIDGVPGLS